MRDYGIDKGFVQFRDDSDRRQRGWSKGFFGFRKMFRDYLTKLNVAFYDECCPAATPEGIFPLRANTAGDNTLEYFNGTAWVAFPFDVTAANITATNIALADGTVGALAVQIGADGNNGLYGVSDTELGVAVEGANVATISATGIALASAAGIKGTSVIGVTVVPFFPTTAQDAMSGTGPVSATNYYTRWTSTGAAQAITLSSAATLQIGQRKKIHHVVDGGSGILTSVFVGGTTITFTTAGEFADLMWTGTAWAVLELGNTVTIGTLPVLA